MTLVVYYLNSKFAVIASDRKLTYPDMSQAENDATKIVAWSGGMVFGFTGQAYLGTRKHPQATMQWLADEIAGQHDSGQLNLHVVADKLTAMRLRGRNGRLAIGGIGFVDGHPRLALVSNMHGPHGDVLTTAESRFGASLETPRSVILRTLGARLPDEELRRFKSGHDEVKGNSDAIAQILAGMIERMAGKLIGDQALISIIEPRQDPRRAMRFNLVRPAWGSRRGQPASNAASPLFVANGWVMHLNPGEQNAIKPR